MPVIEEKVEIHNGKANYVPDKGEFARNILYSIRPSKSCNENWEYTLKGEDWECKCSEG